MLLFSDTSLILRTMVNEDDDLKADPDGEEAEEDTGDDSGEDA